MQWQKKKNEINIRSSAAEYLTYVASVGEQEDSIKMRYEGRESNGRVMWKNSAGKTLKELQEMNAQNAAQGK